MCFILGDIKLPSLHSTHCIFDEGLDHPWHKLDGMRKTETMSSSDLRTTLVAAEFPRRVQEAAHTS